MAPAPGLSRSSMVIAGFSTIVEWYDFTLYLYFATVLSRVFFGGGQGGLAVTLAGFAVAYLLRPLGAMVFGHIGDRFGRRRMMLASMALMSGAMLATAGLATANPLPTAPTAPTVTPTANKPPTSLAAEAQEVIKPRRAGGAPSSR